MNLLVATPFEQYNLLPFVLVMIALIVMGIRFQIPIFLLIAGMISIDIAIELVIAERSILIVTIFAVFGIYLGLVTLRGK